MASLACSMSVARVAPGRAPATSTTSSKHIRAGTRPASSVRTPRGFFHRVGVWRMCRGEARAAIMPQPPDRQHGVRADGRSPSTHGDRGVRGWVKRPGASPTAHPKFSSGGAARTTGTARHRSACAVCRRSRGLDRPTCRAYQPGGSLSPTCTGTRSPVGRRDCRVACRCRERVSSHVGQSADSIPHRPSPRELAMIPTTSGRTWLGVCWMGSPPHQRPSCGG